MPITTRPSSRLLMLTPLLAMFAVGCSEKESSAPEEAAKPSVEHVAPAQEAAEAEPAPAPEPVAEPAGESASAAEAGTEMAEADTGAAAGVDGEAVYNKSCMACHAAGVAGAPKLGDQAAWEPRIAKGEDALFQSVKNGLNAMPPMGACPSCSDDELRAAIAYMVSQAS